MYNAVMTNKDFRTQLISYLGQNPKPLTIAGIVRALNLSRPAVMSHLFKLGVSFAQLQVDGVNALDFSKEAADITVYSPADYIRVLSRKLQTLTDRHEQVIDRFNQLIQWIVGFDKNSTIKPIPPLDLDS